MHLKQILILPFLVLFLFSCSTKKEKDYVVIGIANDITSLNPLYSFSIEEGNITELLFLSLFESNWDSAKGEIKYAPMLARHWEWTDNKESLIIELRDDVLWSDGAKCTIDDVIFSFDIYSDPIIRSRALGYFDKFYTDENGKIDVAKSFEKLGKNRLKINFREKSNPDLIEVDHPILPKHYFEKYGREGSITLKTDIPPVTNGPYKVKQWRRSEAVILSANYESVLAQPKMIPQIVFKVIPEYQIRIYQLINKEIDFLDVIKTDDMENLHKLDFLKVVAISGSEFDYIGWNSIATNGNGTNTFFSSPKVRVALTYALNRELVINEYLRGYGQIANSPVSSLFCLPKSSFLNNYEFNPKLAKKILEEEGWVDSNNDGIIDKDGVEFMFVVHIPIGNPRREFAALLFKNNLKSVGIDVRIEMNELGNFVGNLRSKKYDAWMASWGVPIPINLKVSWHSKAFQNFSSYQNSRVDSLFTLLTNAGVEEKRNIYTKIELILNQEQPYSFLYWVDNITAYNKRLHNVSITPLGAIHNSWKWNME